MFDTPQRLSVVLEYDDVDDEWTAVAMLIDERGRRRRATLARAGSREEVAQTLDRLFAMLPEVMRRIRQE